MKSAPSTPSFLSAATSAASSPRPRRRRRARPQVIRGQRHRQVGAVGADLERRGPGDRHLARPVGRRCRQDDLRVVTGGEQGERGEQGFRHAVKTHLAAKSCLPLHRPYMGPRLRGVLFHPLTLKCGLVLPNRIALAPMTNGQSLPDGPLGDDELRWLARRADGGFGMIETCAALRRARRQGVGRRARHLSRRRCCRASRGSPTRLRARRRDRDRPAVPRRRARGERADRRAGVEREHLARGRARRSSRRAPRPTPTSRA